MRRHPPGRQTKRCWALGVAGQRAHTPLALPACPLAGLGLADQCAPITLPCTHAPHAGLSFSDHYGENSTWLSAWLGEQGRDSDAHLALLVGDLAYAM